jgi:hypothetical protein
MRLDNDSITAALSHVSIQQLTVRPCLFVRDDVLIVSGDEDFDDWLGRITNIGFKERQEIHRLPLFETLLNALHAKWIRCLDELPRTIEAARKMLEPILSNDDDLVDIVPWACPRCGSLVELNKLSISRHLRQLHHAPDVTIHDIRAWVNSCRNRVSDSEWPSSGPRYNQWGERIFPPKPLNIGAVGLPRRR